MPKTKKDILKVYHTWMYSYLNGDVATYDSYFADNYHFIGSTNNEEFLNRKDTTQFFKDTAEQFSGKTDLRKENITIETFNELIFITHVFDAWFLNGSEWTYYSRFRFSSILQEKKEGWKFIYQHFSIADSKTDEGESIGFDKVNSENQELREAIKRRTVELEEKNRELEIEGALERIRAQAVAMRQSTDLLDIVVAMRNEFTKLGHEAHYFWHMMWLPEKYEKAMTSGDGSKIGFVMELPRHMHGDIPQLAKWEKSKKSTVIYPMNVKEAIAYVDKMVALGDFKNIDPQAPTHDDIKDIGGLTFIMARTTHGEIGYSLPGVGKNPPKEDTDILVKFAGAFDLAHQRFLDLQKAEKQAKETKIELSLERIRFRVAEMKASSDLFDIVVTMRNEFLSLGHEADYFWHMKWLPDSYEMSMTAEDGGRLGMVITVPKFVHEQIKYLHKWEKSNEPYFVLALTGEEAWDYIDNMNTHGKYQQIDPHAPTEEDILHIGGLTFIIARTTHGEIGFSLAGKIPDPPKESIDTLLRFAKVFDLAYKRFEDLQKAEKQAREVQIELALEKVRSRTMAMQHSDELAEASFLLDKQVRELGIKTWGCAFNIYGQKESTEWFGNEAGVLHTYTVPREGVFKEYYDRGQKGESLFIEEFSGEECIAHYEYMSSLPVIGDVLKTLKKTNNGFPTYQIDHVVYFKYGYLLFITRESVPEAHDIFKRFAKVFEQTYTRFLDLQKAEAQAREAQIEASLERVRSQAMAMRKSDDLVNCTSILFDELEKLNLSIERSGIGIFNPETKDCKLWSIVIAEDGTKKLTTGVTSLTIHPMLIKTFKCWETQESLTYILEGKELLDYYELVSNSKFILSDEIIEKSTSLPKEYYHYSPFGAGGLYFFSDSEPLNEDKNIIHRFSEVFDLTYTRFLDLQKAEEQTRQAQINLAVERVRAKALAMHKSEEIMEVVAKLKDEVMALDIPDVVAATIFLKEGDDNVRMWDLSSLEKDNNGYEIPFDITFKLKEKDPNLYVKRVWENQADYFIELQEKKDFKRIVAWLRENKKSKIAKEVEEFTEKTKLKRLYHAVKKLNNGKLAIDLLNPPSEEMETILIKMGAAFDLAYKRFEDLQKAEAQAREAQIEASLERVRAKAMSMQNSDELDEVLSVLCEQFDILSIVPMSTHMTVLDFKNNTFTFRETGKYGNRSFGEQTVALDAMDNWKETVDKWKADKATAINKLHFPKEQLPKVWEVFHESFASMPEGSRITPKDYPDGIYHTAGKHPFGYIGMNQIRPATEEEEQIVIKFANEFGRAYQRFLDLQKAENQAREAKIEAALERVRSRSLSMQQPEELNDVVQLIAEKLQELDVILDLGGVVICTYFPDSKDVQHWIATPDSESSGKFLLPYFDHAILNEAWASKNKGDQWFSKAYSVEEKNSFFEHAFVHSDYKHFPDQAKKDILNRKHHTLSFAWSKYSALLIPSYSGLMPNEIEKDILIRFAKVFEHAYIRFMDLQEKETQAKALFDEKQRLEKTLSDLQTTQKQLIQSEKMASLGELTAGIAHEIQNPLNFVNNFSEVSKELLDEMLEEIEAGDMEEVRAIMADVVQNLEKINHHGNRADGIVKGMLQHSRGSGYKKEPTNINALADEYLRLAYHGLRAKDKAFNSELVTDFDDTIKTIDVIPQDIGRVILNLLTNAFYVVNEKKKSGIKDFNPSVSIATKKKKNTLEIKVTDNGNGMPDSVKEKIFQPFFTTKPTGQGTGLGLSMSYDIITKGHDGDLKVETKQGEGTTFTITLPVNNIA